MSAWKKDDVFHEKSKSVLHILMFVGSVGDVHHITYFHPKRSLKDKDARIRE